MKRKLLLLVMSLSFMACSVDNEEIHSEDNQAGSLDAQFDVNNDDPCSPTIIAELCAGEIKNPDVRGFTNFYEAQIQVRSDLPVGGVFSPSMEELVEQYQEEGGLGTFATTYTVETENCGVTTAEVVASVTACETTPTCGTDILVEECVGNIDDPDIDRFDNYYRAQIMVNSDLPIDGTFDPSMEDLYQEYQQSAGMGTFSTNYTVETEECGVETIEVTVRVENCEAQACAEDIIVQECSENIVNPNTSDFDSYYRAQIQTNSELPRDGTFSPSMEELHQEYEQSGGIGTFATNYTVDTEECGEVTIVVAAEVSSCVEYDPADNEMYVEVCSNEVVNPNASDFETFFRAQVQTLTDLPTDGSFDTSMEELLNDYYDGSDLGTYTTNYTVDTEDQGEVTIEITVEITDCIE